MGGVLGAMALFASFVSVPLVGYVSNRHSWPDGEVRVELQLGNPSGPLSDGNESWNRVALEVIEEWNAHLERIQLVGVAEPPISDREDNSVNEVFFSDTLYGDDLGDALAVTIGFRDVGVYKMESDIVVNTAYTWDSYRGELFSNAQDLRRVLLHEFGHLLGLDHPDENLQDVDAIMQSVVGDIETLQPDDIAGITYFYQTNGPEGGVGNADDHGGLFVTATPVAWSSTTAGALQDWDRDIFRVELPAAGSLDVRTRGDLDTFGYLCDAAGEVMAFNDQSGEADNFRIVIPTDRAAVFYIVVEAYFGFTEGDYSLMVKYNSDPGNGDTVGDEFDDALPLPLDGTFAASLEHIYDLDTYRIEVTEFGRFSASTLGETDTVGALFDGAEQLITVDDDTGEGYNFSFQSGILAPGTYYLNVSSVVYQDLGDYELITAFQVVDGEASNQARLSNLSVRTIAGGEYGPLIMGFVSSGSSKSLLLRAVGRGLADFEIPDTMDDPMMTLVDSEGNEVAENDDWLVSDQAVQITALNLELGAFPLTSGVDSALIAEPDAGAYTLVVDDFFDTGGQVLIEAYDADDLGSPGRLINLSTRAEIGLNGTLLTAGFVVAGEGNIRLLIRGIGPKLAEFSVEGVLANPRLQVFDGASKLIAENDDWSDNEIELAAMAATVGAFPLTSGSFDAALIVELPAGVYTVQMSGDIDESGQGLIELYELP